MRFADNGLRRILSLSAIALLSALMVIGCSQGNKSKIVGSWKTQSVKNDDGSVQYTMFRFYKEGNVSKKTVSAVGEESSRQKDKMIGKYTFSEDKNSISITWDVGSMEKMNIRFPQEDKMVLGGYEMEKIR